MSLIDGVGDEVTQFFIFLIVTVIAYFAWRTTNISDQRHVRTVLLLDRRRTNRTHRRLTNHTQAVTIIEGTTTEVSVVGRATVETLNGNDATEGSVTLETSSSANKPPQASTSNNNTATAPSENQQQEDEEEAPLQIEIEDAEQNIIIEAMDADTANVVRQRRIAFYDGSRHLDERDNFIPILEVPEVVQTTPQQEENNSESNTTTSQVEEVIMEHNYAERSSNSVPENEPQTPKDENCIRIKLKYINDDLKLVDGLLQEQLGDFKKRHFQLELSTNKLIRLIFNGQVLQPDTVTLASCGLFDNCVVHCLVHQKRPQQQGQQDDGGIRSDGPFSATGNRTIPQSINNNNQGRDWDFGNFLVGVISFFLMAAWYFRYVYAYMYTVTATVGLILLTVVFTIILIGMHFPDQEQNLQQQQQQRQTGAVSPPQ